MSMSKELYNKLTTIKKLYYRTFLATFNSVSTGQFHLIGNASTTNILSLQLASMLSGSHLKDYLNIVTTCL